ncbi:Imidazolonepropionase [Streptoalloteichus tenebrarius]|uniref:Imidazolonepropionase n=1 Tax=Streptoalloteichus tenebrarius (strain ATCC 17920 / DSM 40477 / JCM 4838 / CBS 697.72 / NBRC 16177 / NCIMB 11028 / NRRL B-12390 / A12253. 1 / ISP 5477) TaxID=1933 RepID=A0ABT1HQ72_STRSD|nr:amidohydrolase family protein [Streptoalloteichus tenebrarius]MCP2257654.1 Imidazolonepropionase [Streptoalloteichus tenebrarius]BFE98616.1 amidohydrolase family protein [Streptoalloteichus tenebrarius]
MPTPLALTHVTVIDATGAPAQPDMTVIVRDGVITTLGRSSEVPVPADATTLDLTGRHLIPGLADMHVHTDAHEQVYLPLCLANGVTTLRQMSGQPHHHQWRRRIAEGSLLGPRLTIGSKIIDGVPSLWDSFPDAQWDSPANAPIRRVSGPDDARRAVREAREEGADFVKVYSRLRRDVYLALVDEAHRLGIPFAGHIPDEVPVVEAAEAGQASFEHVHALFPATSQHDVEHLRALAEIEVVSQDAYSGWFHQITEVEWEAAHAYSPFRAARVFQRLAATGAAYTPTLTMHRMLDLPHLGSLADDRLKYLPASMLGIWEWVHDEMYTRGRTAVEAARRAVLFQRRLEVTQAMAEAGVRLLAGTDNPTLFGVHGFDLHTELDLLVTAGLSPMAALQAATREPARFLGLGHVSGTVEQGKRADLVVVDGDPLEDIRNTRHVHAVVVDGHLIDAATRTRMLAEVEAAAAAIGAPPQEPTRQGCC